MSLRTIRVATWSSLTAVALWTSILHAQTEGTCIPVSERAGREAWYTLEGSQCLETPSGRMDQQAGGPGVMAVAGVPMVLIGTGSVTRRSLVLILQDATQPRSTPAHDWVPKGLCQTAAR